LLLSTRLTLSPSPTPSSASMVSSPLPALPSPPPSSSISCASLALVPSLHALHSSPSPSRLPRRSVFRATPSSFYPCPVIPIRLASPLRMT
jgi:hypothetical protein